MKSKLLSIVILLTVLLFSMPASLKGQNTKDNLIFQSGFEGTSEVIDRNGDADITGVDNSLPDHNDWVNDLDNNPNIGNFSIQYQGGDNSMRYAKIIPEPGNPSNHVLQFWLDSPNVEGKKGRIQANLYGNSGLFEFSQSVRVFLPDDFNTVKKFPQKIGWLTIAEFWNNITWSQDVPYRFRITLGIGKNVEGEGDLSFILDAEDCQLFADGGQKYSTKGLIDFMKSQGKTLQIYWDDYKLWNGRGPNL